MTLLLDMHAFLWFLEDSPQLSATARIAIESRESQVFVSVVSLWEIAIKSSLGKLALKFSFSEVIHDQLGRNAMDLLPLDRAHLERLHALPFHHHDPFDRVLVAQALAGDLVFVTRDAQFAPYGARLLW